MMGGGWGGGLMEMLKKAGVGQGGGVQTGYAPPPQIPITGASPLPPGGEVGMMPNSGMDLNSLVQRPTVGNADGGRLPPPPIDLGMGNRKGWGEGPGPGMDLALSNMKQMIPGGTNVGGPPPPSPVPPMGAFAGRRPAPRRMNRVSY